MCSPRCRPTRAVSADHIEDAWQQDRPSRLTRRPAASTEATCSAVFSTTVQPAARAGAGFHPPSVSGKFHGDDRGDDARRFPTDQRKLALVGGRDFRTPYPQARHRSAGSGSVPAVRSGTSRIGLPISRLINKAISLRCSPPDRRSAGGSHRGLVGAVAARRHDQMPYAPRHGGICVSRLRPGEIDQCRAVSQRSLLRGRAVDRCPALASNEHAVRKLGVGGELRQSVAATGSETMRSTSLSGG